PRASARNHAPVGVRADQNRRSTSTGFLRARPHKTDERKHDQCKLHRQQQEHDNSYCGECLANGDSGAIAEPIADPSAGKLSGGAADAASFVQTNLISDVAAVGATVTDLNLVNPWGVSFLPGSPFWISDQRLDLTTLYRVTGSSGTDVTVNPGLPLVHILTDPNPPTGPHGPTGQVSNTEPSSFHLTDPVSGLPVGDGNAARFIFANLDGTISAWNPSLGTTAFIEHTTPGAVYTGLAINQADTMLYAADT